MTANLWDKYIKYDTIDGPIDTIDALDMAMQMKGHKLSKRSTAFHRIVRENRGYTAIIFRGNVLSEKQWDVWVELCQLAEQFGLTLRHEGGEPWKSR